ncbi:PREDICTED: fibroblast growth factor receptor 3-like isoform X1 [Amphimedon queenslandica]|uniref:receptor protein-tyrosine kinase n=1 Tax=Amphimedon queenslandica TaxID=400682 RepID=A0AAN0K2C3_AMPQE|nr:PREDICTED: fibroblast growth factor receptor 3-like isoform X1 [Amphimedon queenslandica]|eukprot:XP_019863318.1 PREDICTED: fibroblast growth factor receptor 3-like isoform X1 [Amphimedon queenslandica]
MNVFSRGVYLFLSLYSVFSVVVAGTECNEEVSLSTFTESYAVEAAASFSDDGSILSLSCAVTDGDTLQPGQELVWTEGGIEIQGKSYNMTVQQTNTSSLLTIYNVTDGLQYGEYGCQCHNRHNHTHNSLSKLIATVDSFIQHCSNLNTTVAIPDTDFAPTIATHYVSAPGQSVSIICNQSGSVLARESGGVLEEVTNTFIVSSPGHQGKFVCIKAGTVVEIHYVVIEDYEPIQFVFPPIPEKIVLPFSVGSTSPPTLCAVYSPIPLQSFRIVFRSGEAVVGGLNRIYSKSGPLGEDLWRINLIPNEGSNLILESLDLNCRVETVWETVTSERYKVDFEESNTAPIPSVCVTASVTPPSPFLPGSSFTIQCTIQYDIEPDVNLHIIHTTDDGLYTELDNFPLSSCDGLHQTRVCSYTIDNALRLTSDGNYSCNFSGVIDTIPVSVLEIEYSSTISPPLLSSTIIASSSSNDISTTPVILSTSSSTGIISYVNPTSGTNGSQVNNTTLLSVSLSLAFLLVVLILSGFGLIFLSKTCSKRKRRKRRESVRDGPIEIPARPLFTFQQSLTGFDEALLNSLKANDMESVSISLASASPSLLNQLRPSMISRMMAECLQELHSSDWYVPYHKLSFEGELGSGAFGTVKKARVAGIKGDTNEKVVAVKMLKCLPSEEDMRDIITEFNILKHVGRHDNIVGLLGASEHNGQLLVIVEYCSGGNLLQHLRKKRQDSLDPLTTLKQIKMALQVSRGMAFLSTQKCVHRDLAARNILLDHEGTLKVADFGLARETLYSIYTKTSKGKIPFKWMSPESIFDKIYTTKSDVWSFGVLLMEIITLGQTPYPGKTVDEVIECLRSKKTMTKPQSCPIKVYDIMRQCWQFDPKLRPSFHELITILEQFLADYRPESPSYIEPVDIDEGVSTSNDTNSPSPVSPNPPLCQLHNDSLDSGHQELPSIHEMYSALMSCDPELAEELHKLCLDCQRRCLNTYYCNYISVSSETSCSSEDSTGSVKIYTRLGGEKGGDSKNLKPRNIRFGKYSFCRSCRYLATPSANAGNFLKVDDGVTSKKGQREPSYLSLIGSDQGGPSPIHYVTQAPLSHSISIQISNGGKEIDSSPSKQSFVSIKTPLSLSPRRNGTEMEGHHGLLKGQCQVLWDTQSTTSGGYIQTVV